MKDYEDEAFDDIERAQQRKVATGMTDGSGWRKRQIAEQGEPVGVFHEDDDIGHVDLIPHQGLLLKDGDKLYTTPQQRTWVGLTDEEKEDCLFSKSGLVMDYEDVVNAVEAKLKQKNGYAEEKNT